jgi:hypothetical protein
VRGIYGLTSVALDAAIAKRSQRIKQKAKGIGFKKAVRFMG